MRIKLYQETLADRIDAVARQADGVATCAVQIAGDHTVTVGHLTGVKVNSLDRPDVHAFVLRTKSGFLMAFSSNQIKNVLRNKVYGVIIKLKICTQAEVRMDVCVYQPYSRRTVTLAMPTLEEGDEDTIGLS